MSAPADAADWLGILDALSAGVSHHVNNPLLILAMNLDRACAIVTRSPDALAQDLDRALVDANAATSRICQFMQTLGGTAEDEPIIELDIGRVLEAALDASSRDFGPRMRVVVDRTDIAAVFAHEKGLRRALVTVIGTAMEDRCDSHVDVMFTLRPDARGFVCLDVYSSAAAGAPWTFERARTNALAPAFSLVSSRRLVGAFGGRLEVRPTGDALRMLLPTARTTSATKQALPRASPPAPKTRTRVLVVDDEPLVARASARVLAAEHEVIIRTSAREALDGILSGERYDAIVCDLMMAEMSGPAFYEALQSSLPDLAARMVFVTGGAFTGEAREFVESVQQPVLTKPFARAELVARVNELLG